MSGGMPELGSKISLISKADIRYEGRLFTVDPQECTIALANGESQIKMDTEISLPLLRFPVIFFQYLLHVLANYYSILPSYASFVYVL